MPTLILKLAWSASLAAALLSGCAAPPARKTPSAPAPKAEGARTPGKTPRTAGDVPRKALAAEPGRWSAPVPAPPKTPLAALKERVEKRPDAPGADQALLDMAKRELGRGDLGAAAASLERLQERFPLSPLYPESAFYLGLTLQAAGRHERARIPLRGSLRRETDPKRRALLEAALGEVYEKRGDAFSALLAYGRAVGSDPEIHRKDLLIRRVGALAKKIRPRRLLRAVGRLANSPVEPYLRAALAERTRRAKPAGAARAAPPGRAKAPAPPPSARVGILLPLSGAAASAGERVYRGIRLALRRSLARRPGLRIQLAVRDTRSAARSAGEAARLAAELIEKEKVVALIGPLLTEAAESAARIANRRETPLLTPFAARMRMNPEFAWVFRNSLTNRMQGGAAAAYAVRGLGLRRFAVLHPDDRDGRELTDAFARAAGSLGGEVVRIVSFPANAIDFGSQMRALGGMDDRQLARRKLAPGPGKSDPLEVELDFEALFLPVRHDKAVLIAPQLPFYNMRGVRLLGGGGWNSPRLLERGERYVEGAVFVAGFFAGAEEPEVARFAGEYESRFGRKPDLFSALGHDAARIIFSAIAEGARTRAQVREYLAALRGFQGAAGRTDMGAEGDARRELFALSAQGGRIRRIGMVAPHEALEGGGVPRAGN